MSYCRFSDDNFRCDFYAYADRQGYTLHVAGSRMLNDLPPSPLTLESLKLPSEEWEELNREWREALETAASEDINLPGAGGYHRLKTLEELRDMIVDLTGRGFRAPEWLLPSLQEEIEATADE